MIEIVQRQARLSSLEQFPTSRLITYLSVIFHSYCLGAESLSNPEGF